MKSKKTYCQQLRNVYGMVSKNHCTISKINKQQPGEINGKMTEEMNRNEIVEKVLYMLKTLVACYHTIHACAIKQRVLQQSFSAEPFTRLTILYTVKL